MHVDRGKTTYSFQCDGNLFGGLGTGSRSLELLPAIGQRDSLAPSQYYVQYYFFQTRASLLRGYSTSTSSSGRGVVQTVDGTACYGPVRSLEVTLSSARWNGKKISPTATATASVNRTFRDVYTVYYDTKKQARTPTCSCSCSSATRTAVSVSVSDKNNLKLVVLAIYYTVVLYYQYILRTQYFRFCLDRNKSLRIRSTTSQYYQRGDQLR